MTEPSPYSEPDADPPVSGAPRWFKVFAVIAAVVVLLFVIALLTGGGGHGPGRHGEGSGGRPASTVAEHQPPAGDHTP